MSLSYSLKGIVVPGAGRGRTLGYPTANIHLPLFSRIPEGTFAVTVRIPTQENALEGVAFVGKPTTFGDFKKRLEVHLFSFEGNLLEQELTVFFFKKLRENKTFASQEELLSAIQRDILEAKKLFDLIPV